jgi:peroxiredoxin
MEIPHFKELQTKYGARGLQVVGITLEQDGAAVKKFADAQGINYPLLLADARVVKAYGDIRSIPTTFVIDRNGQILRRYVGYQSKETFERDIEPLLR